MKIHPAILAALALSPALANAAPDLPYNVPFELGDSVFKPGDNITIQKVHGTGETIAVGGTYAVDGAYTLASHDVAHLCFFTTCISNNGATPILPEQDIKVKKGSGSFHLVETMNNDGYLHVSFYTTSNFGGVYFGQGNRVLRAPAFSARPLPGPNKVLMEYLGNPVETFAGMDARYSKEGLISAVELAARSAKVSVKKLAIDDSEFPFLVGMICAGSDAAKLKAQFKKMDGYEYGGSVGNDRNSDGSDTCNTFSLVPHRAFPRQQAEQIQHRLLLRQEVFFDRLMSGQF